MQVSCLNFGADRIKSTYKLFQLAVVKIVNDKAILSDSQAQFHKVSAKPNTNPIYKPKIKTTRLSVIAAVLLSPARLLKLMIT